METVYDKLWPKVQQVVAGDNFTVYAYFNDGSVRMVDVKPLLKQGTVFEPMMDAGYFREKLAVINDTVAWDVGGDRDPTRCVDLDPFVIFESPAVADPLADVTA